MTRKYPEYMGLSLEELRRRQEEVLTSRLEDADARLAAIRGEIALAEWRRDAAQ